jgi:aminoglycoside phosphotransferase
MATPRNDHTPAVDHLASTARRLLAAHGARIEEATRPVHSASNEVWLGEQVVLRLSRGNDGSLAREAALAAILPAEVGYPRVLGHGVVDGLEWIVTARLPGTNLAEAWPAVDEAGRTRAVGDLWTRLRAVHRTDADRVQAVGCQPTPFYALDESDARQQLDWLVERQVIDQALHGRLRDMLAAMFRALAGVPFVLAHTDAGPHNAVWSGPDAVPVDFEFAGVAPADLDLEGMLRHVAMLPGGPAVASHLVDQSIDLLALPGARDRLWGYAVLRDLWGLHGWVRHAEATRSLDLWEADADDIGTWAPWPHLHGHANRTSWLADLSL